MNRVKIPRGKVPKATKFNEWVNKVVTAIETLFNISTSGEIIASVQLGKGIHLHVPPVPIAIVKTTSTITARSGATPGQGTATVQMFGLTDFRDDPAFTNMTVHNYSSSATLTPSGKYGVAVKLWGVLWLVVVEC